MTLLDNNFFQLLQWGFYLGGDIAIALYLSLTIKAMVK